MKLKRYSGNPIIVPSKKSFENYTTYNPCCIFHDGKVNMIYRAEDKPDEYVSVLCLATSKDGYKFRRYSKNPVLKPTRPEEKRGCEDPRIAEIDGTFYMTYTAFSGVKKGHCVIGLALAISKDLVKWKKQGVIFPGYKAGQIHSEKVNDEYIMFLGEGDIEIARSSDLLNWTIDKKPLIKRRKSKFDSKLVEVGPPAITIDDKLVLFYNSSDQKIHYRVGFVVLDRNSLKILYRCRKPVFVPVEDFEKYGKLNNVVFLEGLVELDGKYFLYYGGADQCVGVATISKRALKKEISSLLK